MIIFLFLSLDLSQWVIRLTFTHAQVNFIGLEGPEPGRSHALPAKTGAHAHAKLNHARHDLKLIVPAHDPGYPHRATLHGAREHSIETQNPGRLQLRGRRRVCALHALCDMHIYMRMQLARSRSFDAYFHVMIRIFKIIIIIIICDHIRMKYSS